MNGFNGSLLAQTVSTTRYAFARIEAMGQWWNWLALAGVAAGVLAFVIYLYIRDTRELPGAVAVTIAGLRILAFAGLFFTFLDFEKSTQREMLQNSKLILLLDASQSMGLEDDASSTSSGGGRRIDLVVDELTQGTMLKDLRVHHELTVCRFDESEQPIELAFYGKLSNAKPTTATISAGGTPDLLGQLVVVRRQCAIAGVLIVFALPAIFVYLFSSTPTGGIAYGLLAGVTLLVGGVILAAIANLTHVDISLAAVVGAESNEELQQRIEQRILAEVPPPKPAPEPEINWQEQLNLAGSETRLGEALMAVMQRHRGQPLAGIVLVSDGRSNAGLPYTDAVSLAKEAKIPVYSIGMGSNRQPKNAAIVDVESPARVYPGDTFTITGFVQAFGMDNRTAKVELISYPHGQNEQNREIRFEDDRSIRFSADGKLESVKFEIEPDDVPGRRVYVLRLEPPRGDQNERDNVRQSVVEVAKRLTRVLLLAGGPTREFRFVRNLLFRDSEISADVLLQTAKPEASQESDRLLYDFPIDADELFEYDAIIAFDPDWEAIEPASMKLLEEWVDRQAGGLIVVAGPIYTSQWTSRRKSDLRTDLIKGLYPVVFSRLGSSIDLGRFQADEPSPIEFSRDGLEAEFLWLGDNAGESQHTWSGFEGVYGYYAVKDVKQGATVYARFANNAEAIDDEMPVYMAGHFYGAGRVFFLASGEMWRIRALEPAYFETFYTKLIRHVGQGRLLRDSKRGVLMVERRRYKIGNPVNIQARITDAQHRPITTEDLEVTVDRPDGTKFTQKLKNVNLRGEELAGREGIYAGQFTAMQLGDYSIHMSVPYSTDNETLQQYISVSAPRKEIENPQRNDALLVDLANRTGGRYFNGIRVASGQGEVASLASQIEPRDRLTPLPDMPDRQFDRILMWWLLSVIAGALCLEWLLRRISKLA